MEKKQEEIVCRIKFEIIKKRSVCYAERFLIGVFGTAAEKSYRIF